MEVWWVEASGEVMSGYSGNVRQTVLKSEKAESRNTSWSVVFRPSGRRRKAQREQRFSNGVGVDHLRPSSERRPRDFPHNLHAALLFTGNRHVTSIINTNLLQPFLSPTPSV